MSTEPLSAQPVVVLVVDDDEQILELMRVILEEAGYLVLIAMNGHECLAVAQSAQPDIILLDVEMPGMDGIAVAALLTERAETRSIPIVMVTGLLEQEDRVRALRAGAVDFLSKPAKAEELVAKVNSLVRLKAYNDEASRQRASLVEDVAGEKDQLRTALEAFSRFVPREFLRCLSKKDVVEVALGDQVQVDLSVLFADIRSFTAMSEKMSPGENFSFLNSYLGRMNPFIWENGGFIDKYIGDAIMALFPAGTGSALNAAIAMLTHMPVYNAQRATFGYAPIRIGIGLHAGPGMLGIIGSDRFMQGTVISDTVNLASRLEGLTKVYGASLVVSNDVLFGLGDPNRYHNRFLDRVKLKGKEDAVPVYDVYDGDPPNVIEQKTRTRETFEQGVYQYHAGNFRESAELFDQIYDQEVADIPVEMYRLRCQNSLKLGVVQPAVDGMI